MQKLFSDDMFAVIASRLDVQPFSNEKIKYSLKKWQLATYDVMLGPQSVFKKPHFPCDKGSDYVDTSSESLFADDVRVMMLKASVRPV